jgi:tetratricopeptide (TPR) repeat protein
MKHRHRTLFAIALAAALALAFNAPLQAADVASAGKPRERQSDDTHAQELNGRVVYQVLLAEIALQRGNHELASNAYVNLAVRTRDPKVLERAIEVASYARRLDLALDAARLWLEVEPLSLRAQQMLTSLLLVSNRFDELAPHLIRMLELDKAALGVNLLGLNRILARNPDRAANFRLIDKVCTPFFGVAEAHYAVAIAANMAEERSRALAEARRALALRPSWEAAALLEAQLLARDSAFAAIAALTRFLERNPNANDAELYLARALIGDKQYIAAKQHFEHLLQTYPDNPEIVYSVAILALQQNDIALAEMQLKRLLTLDFSDKNVAYFYLGQIADDSNRKDDAIAYYVRVGAGEHYLPAQIRSAQLLAAQGKLAEALGQIRAVQAKTPHVQLTIAEAQLMREANQTQAAFDLLGQALSQQPSQPELLYESALLAEKLGRTEVLENYLRKLIELKPDNAQAYNALGYSFADRNLRLPEARELIERALQLSPNDPFILDSLGWVLYRQGDLSGALAQLERAYAQRPDPEIAAHLGEVLWALGRRDDARLTLRNAQQKYPANEVLADAVKRFSP